MRGVKRHVGRPTNEEVKAENKVELIKIFISVISVIVVLVTFYCIFNYMNTKKLKANTINNRKCYFYNLKKDYRIVGFYINKDLYYCESNARVTSLQYQVNGGKWKTIKKYDNLMASRGDKVTFKITYVGRGKTKTTTKTYYPTDIVGIYSKDYKLYDDIYKIREIWYYKGTVEYSYVKSPLQQAGVIYPTQYFDKNKKVKKAYLGKVVKVYVKDLYDGRMISRAYNIQTPVCRTGYYAVDGKNCWKTAKSKNNKCPKNYYFRRDYSGVEVCVTREGMYTPGVPNSHHVITHKSSEEKR